MHGEFSPENSCDSLDCYICLIAVIWNQTYNISKVCLCICVYVYTCVCVCESESVSNSIVSNSLQPHGLQPSRLLCPQESPGNNTRGGLPFLLQGIFPTQGSNPGLLHCRQILYCKKRCGKKEQPLWIVVQGLLLGGRSRAELPGGG